MLPNRIFSTIALTLLASLGFAQTLTVNSPSNGDFLGRSNRVGFNVNSANAAVRVSVTLSRPGGPSITVEPASPFQPNQDGNISDSVDLPIAETVPEGEYTITVRAREGQPGQPGYFQYPDVTRTVQVDVRTPRFLEISPNNNSFVKGTVPIRLTVQESNIKEWRVRVNGRDIPNNTGTTNSISVDWDTSSIENDGEQTVTVTVRDLANNEATQSLRVNLDRLAPSTTIRYPQTSTLLVRGQTITILADIRDATPSSVDRTGVDVILKRVDGAFLQRVSLVSFRSQGNVLQWTGRVSQGRVRFPNRFIVSVRVVDKAGNVAVAQEVQTGYTRG